MVERQGTRRCNRKQATPSMLVVRRRRWLKPVGTWVLSGAGRDVGVRRVDLHRSLRRQREGNVPGEAGGWPETLQRGVAEAPGANNS